jgi:hypothetical protein
VALLNYKYNGKELQETGMTDLGARMYMNDLGRWGIIGSLNATVNAKNGNTDTITH